MLTTAMNPGAGLAVAGLAAALLVTGAPASAAAPGVQKGTRAGRKPELSRSSAPDKLAEADLVGLYGRGR